ncbi:hypothetical protein Barb4_05274 [Bacteroidales bacterium Barb4]|nr:hypothetical protein Barb4_05274 [Bacteroidales bacterium Barb4]
MCVLSSARSAWRETKQNDITAYLHHIIYTFVAKSSEGLTYCFAKQIITDVTLIPNE